MSSFISLTMVNGVQALINFEEVSWVEEVTTSSNNEKYLKTLSAYGLDSVHVIHFNEKKTSWSFVYVRDNVSSILEKLKKQLDR